MIFQDPMTSLNPVLTIEEQMVETIQAHRKIAHSEARERGRSSCSGWWGSRRPEQAPQVVSRTSSRAGCASAS